MMCYKGKTFCEYSNCYKYERCDRAFTPEVAKAANEWWVKGGGQEGMAPIMIHVGNVSCFLPKEEK